jgi:phospholipid-binding lipoprotein MlaA
MNKHKLCFAAFGAALLLMGSGCATVSGPADPRDPLEGYNRAVYKFNDTVDRAFLKPVAQGYDKITPTVIKTGITNFFSNLDDVRIIVNDLLQAKFREAASNTGRVVVNTTVGVAGLIDVGSKLDMPKGNEDLGQTLGVWGVGPGPYFVLPFFGPSTIRDTFGRWGDSYVQYSHYVDHIPTRNTALAVDIINTRANLLRASTILSGAALDEYSFVRDAFLQRRERLIHDGNAPAEKDEFEDESKKDSTGKDTESKPDTKGATEPKGDAEKPNEPEKK